MKESRDTIDNIKNAETAINQDPPTAKPEHQQHFMEQAKRQLAELSHRLGHPLTYCINTFGCQTNARDSKKLLGILEIAGHQAVESEGADFVLFNTCTVRENANLRVYDRLRQLRAHKKAHLDMMIVLCGCMTQEEEVMEKIRKSYRYVDLIFETHNIFKLVELVSLCLERQIQDGQKQGRTKVVVDVWEDTDQIVEDLPMEHKFPLKSGVSIMLGRNNFCSYCITSCVRGRKYSHRPEEIIKEVQKLTVDGVAEVMLFGQDVNSYGRNLSNPITLAQLSEEVEEIDGIGWIRSMTSHPKDLSDGPIGVITRPEKACRHLHLPPRSGGSQMLKVMNQRYTKEQYLDLVKRVEKAVPGISLTTDIIVRSSDETNEDFEETMDVVRRMGFDGVLTFIYSKCTSTPAAAMRDQVPEAIVKERFDRLLKEVQDILTEACERDIRIVQEVLVGEVNDHTPGPMIGRPPNNTVVHFPGDTSVIGRSVLVYLQESKGSYYMGHIADEENEQNQTNNNRQVKIKQK